MNLDRLKLGMDALRSGKYPQGVGYLEDAEGRNCCLGVLTRVAVANGLEISVDERRSPGACVRFEDETAYLPFQVADWYGFDNADGIDPTVIDSEGNQATATYLNDSVKASFAEIADAFERRYMS